MPTRLKSARAISATVVLEAIADVSQAALQIWWQPQATWRTQPEEQLWRSMVAAILGSQVSNRSLRKVLLRCEDAVATPWTSIGHADLEEHFRKALTGPRGQRYRFPHRGAWLLARAARAIYSGGASLADLLRADTNASVARTTLVDNIPGLGPKQASLFLTDVAFSADLAILDRHVLRYVCFAHRDLLSEPVSTISRLVTYESIEARLRLDAERIGVPLAVFDLAVWITMQTVLRQPPSEPSAA